MERLQFSQAQSDHADSGRIPLGFSTPAEAAASGSAGVFAHDDTEDIFDLLNLHGDCDLLWTETPDNTLGVWNDNQYFQSSENNLAGEPDRTGELRMVERNNSCTTLNPFLLLHGAIYPPAACNYCHRYGLQCVVIPTMTAGPSPVSSCSTCLALSQACSLEAGEKAQASHFDTLAPFAGYLDVLAQEKHHAAETDSRRPPNAIHRNLPAQYQHIDAAYDRNKRSSSRKTQRTRLLRTWFSNHLDHPYPSLEDTMYLSRQSGLTEIQVNNWFTNARRRQRTPGLRTANFNSSGSPIPSSISDMTPFQRWCHSLAEDEHLSPDAIAAASASTSDSMDQYNSPIFSDVSTPIYNVQANSAAVSDSSNSASSTPSLRHASTEKLPPPTSHPRKARKTTNTIAYQCTFCRIPFKKKHDWVRHERSVHMPCLDTYTCTMPHRSGHCHPFQIQRTGSVTPECALCGHTSPDEAHYKAHDFETCSERPVGQRTFSRKDHFWQHLCKYHNCRKWEGWALDLEMWRQRNDGIGGRCGFCGIWMDSWDKRMAHVENHFKMGMQMDEWVAPGDT